MKDIIFIGGGPAGYAGALRASQRGLDVLLIEKDRLGGTCLNRGCIPTKTLYKNAAMMNEMKKLSEYGIMVEDWHFDFEKAMERKDSITEQLVSGVEHLIEQKKIHFVKGEGRFLDAHRVQVGDEIFEGRHIVIATGSAPAIPPTPGSDLPGVITSDDILQLKKLPKSLAVAGSGIIALEFAGIFQSFGCETHVIGSKLLRREDSDIQKRTQLYLKKLGMKFHLGNRFKRIEQEGDMLRVFYDGRKQEESVLVETVLMATGRRPVMEGLDLEKAGVLYDAKGIKVDDELRTNVPHIFACGDVTNRMLLAHVATYEALAITDHIAGLPLKLNYDAVPSCTFVFPEFASVGKTEDTLKEAGVEYKVARFNFIANGKALAMGETDGFVKVLSDPDGKILGVHIMGPGASDLIAEATLAIEQGLTADDIEHTIHAHPTLPEAFHEAVSALDGLAIHQL